MAKQSTDTPVRHVRLCEACGQVDDHPRHTQSTAPGDSAVLSADVIRRAITDGLSDAGVAEAMDNGTTVMHIDCCAQRGCSLCQETLKVTGDKRGDALLKTIQGGAIDHLSTVSAADVIREQGRDTNGESVTVTDVSKAREVLGVVGLAVAHPELVGQNAGADQTPEG